MRRTSARFYDMLYEGTKDFCAEANRLRGFFNARNIAPGSTLLDVACGTGQHLAYLQMDYQVEGLDADPGMLAVAAERIPNVPLHQADMRDFDVGRQFQIMTCLFSAIGYMTSVRDLRRAIRTMARHLRADGVLIVEPWFTPERWHDGRAAATFVDHPNLKIARMNVSETKGRVSILDFHYLVARPEGVERFRERIRLGLFTLAEYRTAFESAGLTVEFDPEGLTGRGLFIASTTR